MNVAQQWRSVLARDGRQDGSFVYAVRSTGIYCRPSCASRRPRREQVVFFSHPAAAERKGFRPCRRCRPQENGHANPQLKWVRRLCRYIEEQAGGEGRLTLAALAVQAGLSLHHVQRTFKRILGVTPRQYADAHRLSLLKTRLKKGEDVTTAMYAAGYGSSSRLYERAPARLGMTPAVYRKGGRGMCIQYALADCELGRLLVAGTEKGISMVSLGDSDRALETALRKEYPEAEILRDKGALGRWVRALAAYLRGRQGSLDLPLDLQATAFQMRVWEELQAIPYGKTRTYSEIARKLGQPTATRAVARACATNPVSLVIPCHRVVGADGAMHGYRWGMERKRALLATERKN